MNKGVMKFSIGMRVKVVAKGGLSGKTGTVAMLRNNDSAWVRMDDDLPEELRKFPADSPQRKVVPLRSKECVEIDF